MLRIAILVTIALAAATTPGHAQGWQMPPDDQRCPSKWGVGDQRGSGNLMNP
jgi:hypothetical protein